MLISQHAYDVEALIKCLLLFVCLIGLQIYWTFHAEDAISKTRHDKLVMNNVRTIHKSLFDEMPGEIFSVIVG